MGDALNQLWEAAGFLPPATVTAVAVVGVELVIWMVSVAWLAMFREFLSSEKEAGPASYLILGIPVTLATAWGLLVLVAVATALREMIGILLAS